MGSLDARHRFIAAKVAEAFGFEESTRIEEFINQERQLVVVNDLFRQDGARRIIVTYQKPQDGEPTTEILSSLFLTTGDHCKGKSVYFIRQSAKPITAENIESSLLYGELKGDPVDNFHVLLSDLYLPLLHATTDWGKCSVETAREFISGVTKFTDTLNEAVASLQSGVDLRKPDKRWEVDVKQASFNRAAQDAELVAHYEVILEDWCRATEKTLSENDATRKEAEDVGPNSELEYWRNRMAKFNSLTEQLKGKECRMVLGVLTAAKSRLLKRWKQLDNSITDCANEAKDNVKYLSTLEKYTEPLYNGNPTSILDSLPGLMNNLKMMHTIARYYNTTERMTTLFVKITNQMISNCKLTIVGPGRMWDQQPDKLINNLESCIRLNESYQEQYRLTKDKLLGNPKGKQFDFSENQIFGKFELFCKRVQKLIDMFSTIQQFSSLANHSIEGMDNLIKNFFTIVDDFKKKPYDLLDYTKNQFDRDYLEFNMNIHELETALQGFINSSFENITSTEHALNLLRQFQSILHRENLKADLDSKYMVIFHNYGLDLETVQKIYEKHKHNPPIVRNAPPVAGNIIWSRQLLRRIEEPMRKFQSNKNIMTTKESKKIIRTYNKVARALIEFETLWHYAWCKSIETAKAGLQATLIIRHPENGKLYVNFDREILQLIQETKCLQRLGVEVPEVARMVLLQEDKFKQYYNQLNFVLREYDRVLAKIPWVLSPLLKAHLSDLERKIQPGMTSLTWTSMNIDAYLHRIHQGLARLEDLVLKINDILENRVESNLKAISKRVLVDLPSDQSFTIESFVTTQLKHIESQTAFMDQKNLEVERAVGDLINMILNYPIEGEVGTVIEDDVNKLREHYSKLMFQAILHSTKSSFTLLKRRLGSRSAGLIFVDRAFFNVDVELSVPNVSMNPTLDDIQACINRTAIAILRASKKLNVWKRGAQESDTLPASYFTLVAKDKEVVKSVLLLTGSIEGTKKQVFEYLETFRKYDYLWKEDVQVSYAEFMKTIPSLENYEQELRKYMEIEQEIGFILPHHNIAALCLHTQPLKNALKAEAAAWKAQYAKNLHLQAKKDLESIIEYVKDTSFKLMRHIKDLEDVRVIMNVLKDIREGESEIDIRFTPIEETYTLLGKYEVRVPKEETDLVSELRYNWKKLRKQANEVSDNLSQLQVGFKRDLVRSVKTFVVDVMQFRADYERHGPMVAGLKPQDAMERLRKFTRLYEERERKFETYSAGEELFGLAVTEYPELKKTKRELDLLDKLYSLYDRVITVIGGYSDILWVDVVANIDAMSNQVNEFQQACKKMPKALREWDAYRELKQTIDDFLESLPLYQLLSNKAMRPRHWQQVMQLTGSNLRMEPDFLRLSHLMEANLLAHREDIEELCNAAVKELQIEAKLRQIHEDWADQQLTFANFKNRGPVLLKGQETSEIIEKLEESSMSLGSMASNRYVAPFKDEVGSWNNRLTTVSEMLEQWVVVQNMWVYMEAVFASGDIAKQMPAEAKRFQQIDKNYMKIMNKAFETRNVILMCYGNDLLKSLLPQLTEQLELCQKSLTGYLEAKRNLFPRFYFVSDTVLLEILSQGSEPQAIQQHLQSVFDSITSVTFDRMDRNKIVAMQSSEGEDVKLSQAVMANGNIEDWLTKLEKEMQRTMKDVIRNGADDCIALSLDDFILKYPAQVALLGIQLQWTQDCQEALSRAKSDKQIMTLTLKKVGQVLSELSAMTTKDLSKLDRTKIETLITIQVHQKDSFEELVKAKIKDPLDFDWQKQCRFYWREDVDNCIISICDVDFDYCYEYLGCKERLVITPLTDRCYITLSQALGMYLGGAPAGPAGTGKTETTKDLGRTLGKFVVVFNCSDQMDYRAMGKIYKGLAQSGCWGCFDEFNRIELEVLSVVAQQIACILSAMRERRDNLVFTDGQVISLDPRCGFFITMNPGYAGRQELPENLKTLFRGVTMMVPNRQIIMKVKLAACGYQDCTILAKKFFVLYGLCEQQLSKQAHYDFGLRNILAVLRTAGSTKRLNPDKSETVLLMRTLRDMNLSKFVAEDVPLFLSLINDLFPGINVEKARYLDVERAIENQINEGGLQNHKDWVNKVVQFYEMSIVRHGLMIVGPAGAGKSRCIEILAKSLTEIGSPHKEMRMNPKSITAPQMFGKLDVISNDWTDGIFAALWRKAAKTKNNNTWIVLDGPVDAVWIENLNTVLDDNKLLTLANGDRIPMSPLMKLIFEVENLNNASPATVSRAGIIYISESELGWSPPLESWLMTRRPPEAALIRKFFQQYMDEMLRFVLLECKPVMSTAQVNNAMTMAYMLNALLADSVDANVVVDEALMEKIVLYTLVWGVGGVLEVKDRVKFDAKLREICRCLPRAMEGTTIFEWSVSLELQDWQLWQQRIPEWTYPKDYDPQFSTLFVPTMDSTRYEFLLDILANQQKGVLFVGGPGTAKTAVVLQYLGKADPDFMLNKKINFSSATTPLLFQRTIEGFVEKRQGRTFGPPGGKKMYLFLDDLSMPEFNEWGDQITGEIVRQLIENEGFYNLEKPGEFKYIADVQYVAAMNTPGSGKNDVPNRLKRHFGAFNMTLPSKQSIDTVFGSIIRGRFKTGGFSDAILKIAHSLTDATIVMWEKVSAKMLPTPAKFHYQFNMRDLSRVFQGILCCPRPIIKTPDILIGLWQHESKRVFADRFIEEQDKQWFDTAIHVLAVDKFGKDMADRMNRNPLHFVDFLEDSYENAETGELMPAQKIYRPIESFLSLRERLQMFMAQYNEEARVGKLDLVFFEDAMRHLMRISRIIRMDRGSALLVGVGGSGKQSLTRLASFIAGYQTFQITVTKTYNVSNLFEDLRALYKMTGVSGKSVTFLFTDAEVKEESFLEYINNVLATGEVPNLFAKDEVDSIINDLRVLVKSAQRQGHFPGFIDTSDNLYKLFIDRVRDNLHLVLCMSPVGTKFRIRARKFPGLISGCTIDWFLPWPEVALRDVASKLIGDFKIDCTGPVKESLILHMAQVHASVGEATKEYFQKFRRHVYVTPKSYLSFISSFKQVYGQKHGEVSKLADNINTGLNKLLQAAEQVSSMKVELVQKEASLAEAQKRSAVILQEITVSTSKAEKKKLEVQATKDLLQEQATRIDIERSDAQKDLAAAEPALLEAQNALKAITSKDIQTLKQLKSPPDLIKRIFDGVLVLLYKELMPVRMTEYKGRMQLVDSYPIALRVMADTSFLNSLLEYRKDDINDETIELVQPYIEMEDFTFEAAKKSAGAVAGLCSWVRAMVEYTRCRKIVGPKLESVRLAEAKLRTANAKLQAAVNDLNACEAELDTMRRGFENAMAEKQRLQEEADYTKRKMEMASALINGLAGEKVRWTQQSKEFASTIKRLVGDVALACSFVSYVGPFNQEFREMLLSRFGKDVKDRTIPYTQALSVSKFLVDDGTVGEWNLQGLPTDELSVQNGIMVTRSTRWPVLIDPQGQGLTWLKNREEPNMLRVTQFNDKQFRTHLEDCMAFGRPLLIENIEEEVDPILDPILEKAVQKSGRGFKIVLADKECDYIETFSLFMTTKLPNPHFSPELSAKLTVIDFTVTMKGLEDQLLGRVVQKEKSELEEQRQKLLEDVNLNTKKIKQLEDDLLFRLSSASGNLLDDSSLIEVLAVTKRTAQEVNEKLANSVDTEKKIVAAREEYRPVATRGSILYFLISEMSQVNVMYQTSLAQFLNLFDKAMATAEKSPLPPKRIANIIETATQMTYYYVTRGSFERHKLMFSLLLALKVQMKNNEVTPDEFSCLIKGGAALDIKQVRKKPYEWLSDMAWLNVIQLSTLQRFQELADSITRAGDIWKHWYDLENPEAGKIPDYEDRVNKLHRLLVVRAIREDRTMLAAQDYIADAIGKKYVEPLPLNLDAAWEESNSRTPFVCLLSLGADPTTMILDLAKKKKKHCPAISMGQGQEVQARKLIYTGVQQGNWILLQNCHLGLNYMLELEQYLRKADEIEPEFRIWITSEPHNRFPIGLLQMSIKITNEAPQGMRAGLKRSFQWITQDVLDTVGRPEWRQLLYTVCFLHSVVQERRKFGALGWNVPYEFNHSDLNASVQFVKNHLFLIEAKKLPISWTTMRYMVAEIQYGGRITDDFDRRLFNTYAETYLNPKIFDPNFLFYPGYRIPNSSDINKYRQEIDQLPLVDSPEIFGLHANADLTFRTKDSTEVLNTILETQPKGSSAGVGLSREEIVLRIAEDLLAKMPHDFNKEDCKEKIKNKHGGPKPLNIFLGQEIDRLQKAISITRRTLLELKLAIAGTIVMSGPLQDALDALYDARVPSAWLKVSWPSPTTGLWFTAFLQRFEQLSTWVNTTRPTTYWLTGFFNPQGFLTAVKQEVTRRHQGWALDDVVFHTDVTQFDKDMVKQSPDEGVYIYGLFLDGASWSKRENRLVDSPPKVLFTPIPVLYVSAVTLQDKKKDDIRYQCPLYKIPKRTDLNYVFDVELRTEDPPQKWILRGVALLESKD